MTETPIDDAVDDHAGRGGGVEFAILAAFAVGTLGAVAFAADFWVGGHNTQIEGAAACVALAGFALGLGLWANATLPGGQDEQERETLRSTDAERAQFVAEFEGGEHMLVRRRLVLAFAGIGLTASGIAALFPFRALGPRPGNSLRTTPWHKGRRLVTATGDPLRPSDLADGSAVPVFPEGMVDPANSQSVVIRYGSADFRPKPGRETWTVDNCVAYSRVCTHAGCPVGLYEADTHMLVCPCHQSLFNVLDGAEPEFGPASRPLPQLPLGVDGDGYLIAQSDYHEPVGPGYWNR